MSDNYQLNEPADPAPPRYAKFADELLCSLIVAIGICGVAWVPGAAIEWTLSHFWPCTLWPWYVLALIRTVPALLVGAWGVLVVTRLKTVYIAKDDEDEP
jgi:hypothetical protein